jgi:protein-L-isoaspartate(D-aspartate) O-methyltransferase
MPAFSSVPVDFYPKPEYLAPMAFPYDQTQAENLIDGQLAPNAVLHAGLLDAVRHTPREAFVPEAFAASAYVDDDIPLGEGRFLMDPLTQLKLLQALDPQPHESVLVIGGATGYAAALLSPLVARVELVEENPALAAQAQQALASVGATNVNVVQHPLAHGAPGAAPYDAILIEGGVRSIPAAITAQLKEDGRMMAIENIQQRSGSVSGLGVARYYTKNNNQVSARNLFDAGVSLLPGFAREQGFRFND